MDHQYIMYRYINGFASFICTVLTIIGVIGLYDILRDNNPLVSHAIGYASLFIVGGLGLIVELFTYNLKNK